MNVYAFAGEIYVSEDAVKRVILEYINADFKCAHTLSEELPRELHCIRYVLIDENGEEVLGDYKAKGGTRRAAVMRDSIRVDLLPLVCAPGEVDAFIKALTA